MKSRNSSKKSKNIYYLIAVGLSILVVAIVIILLISKKDSNIHPEPAPPEPSPPKPDPEAVIDHRVRGSFWANDI